MFSDNKMHPFKGDSVDREYLAVYQILHIEIIR